MDASTSNLEAHIRQKLPDLDDYDELFFKLKKLGVTELDDLKYLDPSFLVPPLTIVAAKKLLEGFSGAPSAWDEYKLKQRDQEIRQDELNKSAERDKMTYKKYMQQMRVDIHQQMADLDMETIRYCATTAEEVSAGNTQRNVSAGACSAGVGAAFGMLFGPVGMVAGAGIGATIGGALGTVVNSGIGERRRDQKVQIAKEITFESKKKLEELDKVVERLGEECKLEDLNQCSFACKEDDNSYQSLCK